MLYGQYVNGEHTTANINSCRPDEEAGRVRAQEQRVKHAGELAPVKVEPLFVTCAFRHAIIC